MQRRGSRGGVDANPTVASFRLLDWPTEVSEGVSARSGMARRGGALVCFVCSAVLLLVVWVVLRGDDVVLVAVGVTLFAWKLVCTGSMKLQSEKSSVHPVTH